MKGEAKVFGAVGAFLLLIAAVYVLTSYEEAGTVMLMLAAAMGLWIGVYLWNADRRSAVRVHHRPGPAGEPYLPHASVWPLGVGLGAVVAANGLALGGWALLPGGMLTAASLWGYARQSRRRD